MTPTLAARCTTMSAPSPAARVAAASRRSYSAERGTRTSAPSAARSRVTAVPRKPAPPVTTTALPVQNPAVGSAMLAAHADAAARQLVLEQLDVVLDHDPDEVLERRRRLPAQLLLGLRRVALERVDLG